MAISIPEEKIIDIQNACSIVDVISETVRLKKAGSNFVGLCPFHSEKTPSFSVSPAKQMFYCFGCGEGGNIFSFLMKHERISFPEAAEMLARRCGIDIPKERLSEDQQKRISERESILAINRQAADFFRSLLHDSRIGENAKNYLYRRGIDEETINRFGLGFAPDGWDNALNYFLKHKIPLTQAEKSGLIIPRTGKDGYYDRFRNRIMFPISDMRSQVIGFGGRVMDDSLPKYLNSPETPVYSKSRSLYGLNLSRTKCRETDTVYIVEGYADLLMMAQSGIENAAATLGTALTAEQVRLLKGCASRMVLVYDSDEAGIKAAHRSIDIFRKEEADARFLILPQGHDPDSFLREFGADAFMKSAEKALKPIEFLTESAIKKYGLSGDGKIRIVSELIEPLASVQDKLAQSVYVRETADRFQVDESILWEKIRAASPVIRSTAPVKPSVQTEDNRFEQHIISVMLQCPEIIPEIRRRKVLDYFEDAMLKSVGDRILTLKEPIHDNIVNLYDDEHRKNLVTSLIMKNELMKGENDRTYEGCLRLLDQFEQSRSRKQNSLTQKIKAAEAGNNPDAVLESLTEMNRHLEWLRDKQIRTRGKMDNLKSAGGQHV